MRPWASARKCVRRRQFSRQEERLRGAMMYRTIWVSNVRTRCSAERDGDRPARTAKWRRLADSFQPNDETPAASFILFSATLRYWICAQKRCMRQGALVLIVDRMKTRNRCRNVLGRDEAFADATRRWRLPLRTIRAGLSSTSASTRARRAEALSGSSTEVLQMA